MKTIAIIDNSWDEHHPIYLKIFTQTLLDLAYQVIALCLKPHEVCESIILKYSSQNHLLYTFEIPKHN